MLIVDFVETVRLVRTAVGLVIARILIANDTCNIFSVGRLVIADEVVEVYVWNITGQFTRLGLTAVMTYIPGDVYTQTNITTHWVILLSYPVRPVTSRVRLARFLDTS